MSATAGVLDLSAERGARRLALAFLDDAEAAHQRLERGADDEALHDFRVAVRRLRSTVRGYREALEGSTGGGDRRRLSELADATAAARDLEVHVAWLGKRLDDLPEGERARAWTLLNDMRVELSRAEERLRRQVAKDFPRERWRLARRLRFYQVRMDVDAPAGGAPLASAFTRLVLDHAADLERRLAAVRSIDDQEEAHRARIAAKRLRYLVEPVQAELEGASDVIRRIKKLQDVLGEMHDADVLLARLAEEKAPPSDPPADGDDEADADAEAEGDDGFATLRRLLEEERRARFAAVEADWLQDRAVGFFGAVRDVARAAAVRGAPDLEIERKYLLKRMPAIRGLEDVELLEIDQGYIPGERLAERVRRTRRGGEVKYYRTVKLGKGISRTELEEETTERIFRRLWPLTHGRRVRKRRYRIKDGGFTWEVDRFRDRRLVLCEVELPTEDTHAEPPKWLRREIVRDVTGEDEYTNINLAK
ncbi:MAG TPA: CHAD domain-containing protein [Longimicrobium sp.]|nr:CHAD domain-containing protein [Longimicrobium sp.]